MGSVDRAFIRYTLTAALAVSPAIGIATDEANTAISSPARKPIGIDNFGQINASYYRGSQPDGRDYADLAALGVKTIIDLQIDGISGEQKLVEAAGMKFHRIGMTTHQPPTEEQLVSFLKLVNDPANQPVYVHCAGGRHRTGVMTAVYRMTHDSWNAEQAFKEMKQFKSGADFLHPEFKQFVYAYHVEPHLVPPAVLATSVLAGGPAAAR